MKEDDEVLIQTKKSTDEIVIPSNFKRPLKEVKSNMNKT